MAPSPIKYELLVTRLKNFQLLTDKAFNFTASPSQPQYFLYKFPQDVDSVVIKVVSETVYPCSVVSVQDIVCPVYDLDHNVEFNGVYQSMTKQAAITIQKKDFTGEQFFVVFVIKPEDYACGGSVPSTIQDKGNHTWNLQRTKHLQVTIVPSIPESVYVQAMLFSFLSFLSFYVGALMVACMHYVRAQSKTSAERYSTDDGSGTMAASRPITAGTPEGSSYGAIDESSSSGGRQMSSPEHGLRRGSDTDSSVEEESDFDTMPEIESDKNVIRTKMFLYLSDLSRKDRRIVSKKYKIYFWNIITIAVFYALPVVQLVITYQTVSGSVCTLSLVICFSFLNASWGHVVSEDLALDPVHGIQFPGFLEDQAPDLLPVIQYPGFPADQALDPFNDFFMQKFQKTRLQIRFPGYSFWLFRKTRLWIHFPGYSVQVFWKTRLRIRFLGSSFWVFRIPGSRSLQRLIHAKVSEDSAPDPLPGIQFLGFPEDEALDPCVAFFVQRFRKTQLRIRFPGSSFQVFWKTRFRKTRIRIRFPGSSFWVFRKTTLWICFPGSSFRVFRKTSLRIRFPECSF
ncbi:PREDICTED: SID1 transmembrane family member 1 [Crocodylus porosus]|uniref:SID1 transmembrane family member 1 n=1 Tax=Crocodylus porosus TaxID=8502 RepID=UPI00093EB946|nr:PREDICTED: SID1 transmembrane family member 1 [Crocodylus porosus]